ncbi:MAG: phage tail tube protein [Pseudomonadota bacterium]
MTAVASDNAVLSLDGQAVAGITDRRLSLRRTLSSRAHADSNGWAETSALGAPLILDVDAQGLFISNAATSAVRGAFLAGGSDLWSLEIPGDGIWAGPFVLRALSFSGKAETLMTFRLQMTSNGPITFTPEV